MRGIMNVSDNPDLLRRAEKALPREHSVLATRFDPDLRLHEWIISGPMMPSQDDEPNPALVIMIFQAAYESGIDCESAKIILNARWEHACDRVWPVGEWANYATFQRDF